MAALATYWRKTAEKRWNDAFDKFSYCNKYKFRLVLDIKARRDSFESTPGRHRILVGLPGSGLEQTGWDGLPEHTPDGLPGQRSPDGTRYYEGDGDGIMPSDVTPTVLTHEIGHVVGLGDDRDDVGNALPNRDGTLMIGGARQSDGTLVTPDTELRIDKSLVDRVGRQVEHLGKISCGVSWKGPINGHVTAPSCSPSEIPVHGKLEVSVREHGAVSGEGSWTEEGFSCGGAGVEPTTLAFAVTGTKTRDAFSLQLEGQPGLEMGAQGGHASGSVDVPGAGGYGSSLTFTLDRQDKKEAVG